MARMSSAKLLPAMPPPTIDISALSPNSSSPPVTTNSSVAFPPLNSPPPTDLSEPTPSKKPLAPPAPVPASSKAPPKSPNLLPPPAVKHMVSRSNTTLAPGDDGDSTPPSGERHINLPLVLGVAVGVGIIVVLMIVASVCCSRKKKTKKTNYNHNPMHYYTDGSISKGGGGGYYTSGPVSDWHDGPETMDHNHSMKAKSPPLHSPGGGWHSPMASGEMSTAVYSGPHVPPMQPPSPTIALGFNKSTFTYEELASATSNFCQANLLGQGGFGYVHKGVLPNGKEIAVKQLKAGSGQGEREFQAEVDIISRVHHRHLVSLVGYCIAGTQRLLVYEFVANKTLEYHLHAKGLTPMDWPTRLKIALGSAKGLAYLHEDCHPRIIHRDIKSANILLDLKFEAMVADFGLAKLTSDNNTHVSTRVMGTFGYLAPEYASSGKLTEKSDVFSYGVMLLELITGKRPVDAHTFIEDSLVDWARPVLSRALADGNYDELADTRLDGNYDLMEMARMVACAAACVRHSARRRPKMSQIVRALEGDVSLEDLNEGMRPGQSMLFSSGSDYENSSYTNNMRRMRRVALASSEYSGEYSGPMPDYGLHPSASSSDFSGELNPIGNQRHRAHPSL